MELDTLFTIYQLPTGRRIFALKQLAEAPGAVRVTGLLALVEAEIERCSELQRMEHEWMSAKHTSTESRTAKLNSKLDSTLGSIARVAAEYRDTLGMGDPLGAAGQTLLSRAFPGGVSAVTTLTYVEQVETVGMLLELFRGELEPEVIALGLTQHVLRLDTLRGDLAREIPQAAQGSYLRRAPHGTRAWSGRALASRRADPGRHQ